MSDGDGSLRCFFFSSRRRHTRSDRDWSSDVCSSDLVSWNRFADHDKTMLIGSSDTAPADAGKLNVTVHHNVFASIGQRAPRVRFGKVHVYDNLYLIPSAQGYTYSWGVGVDAKLYVENNVFRVGPDVKPDRFVRV